MDATANAIPTTKAVMRPVGSVHPMQHHRISRLSAGMSEHHSRYVKQKVLPRVRNKYLSVTGNILTMGIPHNRSIGQESE